MASLTIKELAGELGRREVGLYERAKRNDWPFDELQGRGRPTRYYPYAGLPEELQLELAQKADQLLITKLLNAKGLTEPVMMALAARVKELDQRAADVPSDAAQGWQEEVPSPPLPVSLKDFEPGQIDGALQRNKWVLWYRDCIQKRHKVSEIKAKMQLLKAQGHAVPSLSAIQLWDQKLRQASGPTPIGALRDGRTRSGRKSLIITQGLGELITAFKVHNYSSRPARLAEMLEAHAGVKVHGDTVRRWVIKQKKHIDRLLWAYIENPDKAKQMLPYPGQAHGWRRLGFLDMIEWDGTPSDVMTSDGQRWTILAAIDVATRQVALIMSRSSSAGATKQLLKKVCLTWGVPKAIRGDHGTEFVNRPVMWAIANLGINYLPSMPYSGEQKPFIERFFGTLTRGLFEELPGYVGHNVAEREVIRHRKNFRARSVIEGSPEEDQNQKFFRTSLTPEQLFAQLEQYLIIYHNSPHKGLEGETPNERLAEKLKGTKINRPDLGELNLLLCEQMERVVRKDGIHLQVGFGAKRDFRVYQAAEYTDHVGREVVTLIDENPELLHVFDKESGNFLFTAVDQAIDPKLAQEKRAQLQEQVIGRIEDAQNLLEEVTGGVEPYYAVLELKAAAGAETSARLGRSIANQAGQQSNPQLAQAVVAKGLYEQQVGAWYQTPPVVKGTPASEDRFLKHYLELELRIKRGEQLSDEDVDLLDRLERTPAVADYRRKQEGR